MNVRKLILIGALAVTAYTPLFHPAPARAEDPRIYVKPFTEQFEEQQPTDLRSEAAGYRSRRGTYTGGTRSGLTPTTGGTAGDRTPANRTTRTPNDMGTNVPGAVPPAGYRGGGFGGFFGGLAAGSLLGSLFNPFGFGGYGSGGGYGGGVSIIGLIFWGVLLYAGYRIFRRMRERDR